MAQTYLVSATPGRGNNSYFVLTGHLNDRGDAVEIGNSVRNSISPFSKRPLWSNVKLLTCIGGVLSSELEIDDETEE
jgi:hypothetical protein